MNEQDLQSFEAELHSWKPAPAPPELVTRVEAALPNPASVQAQAVRRPTWHLPEFWRWFAPATALAAIALTFALVQWKHTQPGTPVATAQPAATKGGSDVVEIDRELVASYDAIAELSSGVPVRFHCQEWEDKFVFRDPLRGISIERRTPRLEVVPVSLEIY